MAKLIAEQLRIREQARRRVFVFLILGITLALIGDLFAESDQILHVVDEVGIVALGLIAIVYLIATSYKNSIQDLQKQNNWILIMVIAMIIFKIFAITQEFSDPTDFGDEIPILIILILAIINRYT